METSMIAVNVMNIANCVSELVSNSLHVNATSIAIRFHSEERKIQVIDNGIGIPKAELKTIAEYNNKNYCNYLIRHDIHNWKKQTLINIRRLSNIMMITSRYYNSSKTYMKIFKIYHESNIERTERRPSQGTTITIYGFHELSLNKWNIAFMYYLIENIAIANPQTSFTIRDDKIKKVTMIITKPHNPINIFKLLYNKKVMFHKVWFIRSKQKSDIKFCAYIGISNSNFTVPQHIFINNKLLITDHLMQLHTSTLQNTKSIQLTLSEWSNWSDSKNLKQCENNSLRFYKHFDFLPEKLHKLLRGNTKLIQTNILNAYDENLYSIKVKSELQIPDILPHQEIDVRLCKNDRFCEFKINKKLLKFIKILGQLNNELIVGLVIQNNVKILLLMDQHAIHERIRYEQLLHEYKSQIRNQLFSIKLKNPVVVKLSAKSCNLLLSNHKMLRRFGITFNILDNNNIIIRTVPECLKKNNYSELKLKLNIQNLLNELIQNSTKYINYQINDLPITIHNAIVMKACHGAIKFGHSLTLKECKWLLKLLNETKIPTQCAHGRPSIVPLLELTNLETRQTKIVQNLNSYKFFNSSKYF
ncbi:DNA mismatch repair protein Mlh3 [Apis cerana cerana]|uniref:DNA mismatch repair protein Mlh3 n=1 Tax=Apis cerana cerana TaxID=94128 RepID=A0A2A3EEW0_APICC|nr:DNA mismatch repair protein Mlh3 [Apis cerana cerana]